MNKRNQKRKSPQLPSGSPPASGVTSAPEKWLKRYFTINGIVLVAFIWFCYWILAVKNGFMLRWYDEMSLFEPTGVFFHQFLYYPGGLFRYAGSWLTQFMYYPYLGSTVIISLWLLTVWASRIAFNLRGALFPFALLIPMAMLVSVVQLDEAWLSIKTTGYLFSNSIGYLFTITAFLIFRSAGKRTSLKCLIGILIAATYPFGGFFSLLAALLCAMQLALDTIRCKSLTSAAGAILTVATGLAVPLLYYRYLRGNTVDNDFPYIKGLPELMMENYDIYLWMPFILATAFVILLWTLSLIPSLGKSLAAKIAALLAIFGCTAWCLTAEHKSEQLRATVLMLQSIDKGKWHKVNDIMSLIKEPPNYTMRVLENLAIVNLGGERRDMSGYGPINIDPRHSETFSATVFIQVPVNYHVGRFNQSYRWAMEHTVQYGKRVFFLKYMAKDALLNGDIRLARRYNDILLRTMFHRKWAEELQRYIEDPSLIEENPEFNAALRAGENEQQTSLSKTTLTSK